MREIKFGVKKEFDNSELVHFAIFAPFIQQTDVALSSNKTAHAENGLTKIRVCKLAKVNTGLPMRTKHNHVPGFGRQLRPEYLADIIHADYKCNLSGKARSSCSAMGSLNVG